jgi:hypothetical protein
MKRSIVVVVGLLLSLVVSAPSQAAESCAQPNVPTLGDDSLTVTMLSISTVEKTGSFQLTINYRLTNLTSYKKIDEGTFKIFFTDNTSESQYGFFGSFFPGDSRDRSYTWEYLKGKSPLAISYNAGFFTNQISASKLNWAPPGQDCNLILSKTAAEKAVADKTAAEKAATAIKAAEDEAATKKARGDSVNSALKFLVDQVVSTREELKLRIIGLVKIYPAEKIALNTLLQSISMQGEVTSVNYKEIEKTVYQVTDQVDVIENSAAAAKAAATKKTTITCVKGKLSKKVTGVKPKCPTGYKLKK